MLLFSAVDQEEKSVWPKVKIFSDTRQTMGYDNTANNVEGFQGNHVDLEATEAMDYHTDDISLKPRLPLSMMPGIGGLRDSRSGGYVKYNSFANY